MAQVTVTSSGLEPRTYTLNKPRMILGRDPNAEIHLDNLAVSKHHCEIVQDRDTFTVRDLKSSNKTFVNGKAIEEQRLNNGDEIVIGLFAIKFSGPVPDSNPTAPKPAADDTFEPTMQLPPEMVRKKMEEMQREREQGISAARAAAASTVKPQNAPQSQPVPTPVQGQGEQSNNLIVIIVVVAIAAVIVLNVVIWLRNR